MARAKKKNKDWISKAVKHPGAFREWCQKRGHSKANTSCINSGLKASDPTIRRRAALAKAFKNMRKNKAKKRK
jgi:hypothetical protein